VSQLFIDAAIAARWAANPPPTDAAAGAGGSGAKGTGGAGGASLEAGSTDGGPWRAAEEGAAELALDPDFEQNTL
jgi:hypothetical protein